MPAREPLPDYPDAEQVYAYSTQGLGGGHPGGWGGGWGGSGGWGGHGSDGPYGGVLPGGELAMGVPRRPPRADLGRQVVVASNSWSYMPDAGVVLGRAADRVMRELGPEAYEIMMMDAVVSATVEIVILGIVGDKYEVAPRVLPEPGERVDGKGGGEPDAGAEGDRAADIKLARKLADECGRMLERFRRPFRETLRVTTREKLVNGCSLAEFTRERVKGGVDAGKVMITAVEPKPHMSWAFVVDPSLIPQNIWAWTSEGARIIGLDKFLVQSWCPTVDPRGTSILRCAYDPWNFKQAAKPYRAKHMSLFSDPTIVIKYDAMDPGRPQYPIDPHTGMENYDLPPLTPSGMATAIAANFHSGSYAAIPKEWDIVPVETNGDGSAFDTADAAYNREIVQAIILSARATMEAENSSKADNEGATDWSKMRLDHGRRSTADDVERGMFYPYVLENYNKDVADRLCPRFLLGQPHKGDVPALLTAATGAGYKLSPRQLPALDAEFNLPVRTADEVDKMQAQEQAAAAAATAAVAAKANPAAGRDAAGKVGGEDDGNDEDPGGDDDPPAKFGEDDGGFVDFGKGPARPSKKSPKGGKAHAEAELTGGNWVTIRGHAAYIKDGSVVAGGIAGVTHDESGKPAAHAGTPNSSKSGKSGKSGKAAGPDRPSEAVKSVESRERGPKDGGHEHRVASKRSDADSKPEAGKSSGSKGHGDGKPEGGPSDHPIAKKLAEYHEGDRKVAAIAKIGHDIRGMERRQDDVHREFDGLIERASKDGYKPTDADRELYARLKEGKVEAARDLEAARAGARDRAADILRSDEPMSVDVAHGKTYSFQHETLNRAPEGVRAEADKAAGWLSKVSRNGDSPAGVKVRVGVLGRKDDQREYHDRITGAIALTRKSEARTVAHELGHAFESQVSHGGVPAYRRGHEFLEHRAGREEPVSMAKKFPDHGFHPEEMGRKDDFDRAFDPVEAHYIGKEPNPKSSEVLSMGIEKLYHDPVGFASKDPEYAKFVIGMLHGKL